MQESSVTGVSSTSSVPCESVDMTDNFREDEDPEELARDIVVEKLIVSAVTKPIEDKADVEDEIRCKFKAKGITVKELKTFADRRGKFNQSVV